MAGPTNSGNSVYVARLAGGAWHATTYGPSGADDFLSPGAARCRTDGACAASATRSAGTFEDSTARPVGFFPLGSRYAQVDLPAPAGVADVESSSLSACAPASGYCVLIATKVFDRGLGGEASQDYAVTVVSPS